MHPVRPAVRALAALVLLAPVSSLSVATASPPTSTAKDAASGYSVELTKSPCCVDAGRKNTLTLNIADAKEQPVRSFEPVHGKPMHLMAVRSDLSWFAHVHPAAESDGSFTLPQTFPHAGEHIMFAEFKPAGAAAQTVRVPLEVKGEAEAAAPITPDADQPKRIDGYEVRLSTDGTLTAGAPETLTFAVLRKDKPVAEFEPYLGASGHLIVIDSRAAAMQHVHAGDHAGGHHEGGHSGSSGEPGTLRFTATFPQPGVYKLWAEFQHRGRVITAPFVVSVAAP